jgi:methyl-accepting chemotaxis protein
MLENPKARQMIAITLIVAAIIGMVGGAVGVIGVWVYRPVVSKNLTDALTLASAGLKTTDDGLKIADDALTSVSVSVTALEITVGAAGKTLDDSAAAAGALADLASNQLNGALKGFNASIASAQQSAAIVDEFLKSASQLPVIGGVVPYNPNKPLAQGLGEVGKSMEAIPESLESIRKNLQNTQGNLKTIQGSFGDMAKSLGEIKASLDKSRKVIEQYRKQAADLRASIEWTLPRLQWIINLTAWLLTLILVWTAVSQIGPLVQGLEMRRKYR